MKRQIDHKLLEWKNSLSRLPLIVRGARQVGKSYTIEKFGRDNFDSVVTINFELLPNFKDCFSNLNPDHIIPEIEGLVKQSIVPKKTLLFLDEIQECPQALRSLRYFKEKLPDLHVIAAGSLLEFTLNDADFSFPVGRIQFMPMFPMSFVEFLMALGEDRLLTLMENVSLEKPFSEAIHRRLLELVRQYLIIGGMPAVVNRFVQDDSRLEAFSLQESLLRTYELDFGKYASKTTYKYLGKLYERAPELVGKHVKYSKIDPDSGLGAKAFKEPLNQLCHAGLLKHVFATYANGIPLRAEKREKKFKIIFLDVGLWRCSMGLDMINIKQENLMMVNSGALTEQFVGQELLAYFASSFRDDLYFWVTEKKTGSAEVDYVLALGGDVVPVEVKAGKTGRLRSLQEFLKKKGRPLGIRISEKELSLEQNVLTVPLYLISRLPELYLI